MPNFISKNRRSQRGAISTEYVVVIVLVAVGSILAFMYLGFSGRSQSKTVIDKVGGKTRTVTEVVVVDSDPLVEQKLAMDQSGSAGSSDLDFDSGPASSAKGAGGSSAASSRGSTGSSRPATSSGRGSRSDLAGAQTGAKGNAGASSGATDQSGGATVGGNGKKFNSQSSNRGQAKVATSSSGPAGKAASGFSFFWIIVALGVVFGIFFAVMYIGRGS